MISDIVAIQYITIVFPVIGNYFTNAFLESASDNTCTGEQVTKDLIA